MKIKIDSQNLFNALSKANPETKEILIDLFKGQLITSFEDACESLDISPILPKVDGLREKDAKHIIAEYKLIIITEALNEGWKPDFNNWNEKKWYVYPLGGDAYYGAFAGLGASITSNSVSVTHTSFGSRLCFKNQELVKYSLETFSDLWADNFNL